MYDNIKFTHGNMACDNGYFYSVDVGALVQKTAGGNIVFQFPIELGPFESFSLTNVSSLQYDGFSFWTLQDFSDESGILIRRFIIDNFVFRLTDQFSYLNDSATIYSSSSISIEFYTTVLSQDYPKNSSTITIDEFTDTAVFKNSVLNIGPNSYGYSESVTASGVSAGSVILNDTTHSDYKSGTKVTIVASILLFNDYNGIDETGSLIVIDPTGGYLSTTSGIEFKDVKSSKFCRIQDVFFNDKDVFTLIYINATNAKFRDMSNLFRYSADIKGSDEFTTFNDENWDMYGDPVVDSKLFLSTAGSGHDKLVSKYSIVGDFEAHISGSIDDYTTFSGSIFFNHYIGISINSDNYSIGYCYEDVFCVYKNDTVIHTVTASGALTYILGVKRQGGELLMYYSTDAGDINMFNSTVGNTECKISLGLHSSLITVSGTFDDLIYTNGYLIYPSAGTYYGILNMDNLQADNTTVIPIHAIDVVNDNLIRLQDIAMYYGSDHSWDTYNYQVSPIRSFIDFITVDSSSHVIPATGRNTVEVTSLVFNQYSEGVVNKPITFTDDDSVGYMTKAIVHTDNFYNTGSAKSAYKSGVELRIVEITATCTQVD